MKRQSSRDRGRRTIVVAVCGLVLALAGAWSIATLTRETATEADGVAIVVGGELARIDLRLGRSDAAIARLQRYADLMIVIGAPRSEARARRSLASALIALGRHDLAERELTRARELDLDLDGPYPIDDDILLAKLRLHEGEVYEAQKLADRARQKLIALFGETSPAVADIWILKARIEIAWGEHADARASLAKVTTAPALSEANALRDQLPALK